MRKTLFLVRHGETVWNHQNRYQGQRDIPLNEEGERQAGRLAARLQEIARERGFDAVWSSDLSRAHKTAAIATEALGLPVRPVPALREMNFGRWEGLTFPEIERMFPDNVTAYRRDPVGTACVEGESFAQVLDRTGEVLKELWDDKARRILLFAHGGSIKAVLCHMLGWDPARRNRLAMGNTGITEVEMRHEWARLTRYNDTSHLESWTRLKEDKLAGPLHRF